MTQYVYRYAQLLDKYKHRSLKQSEFDKNIKSKIVEHQKVYR